MSKSVVVITPTRGRSELEQCIESVAKQTYKNTNHLIVGDGPDIYSDVMVSVGIAIGATTNDPNRIMATFTPAQTGRDGFNGQRIYAAFPHLVNDDYVAFLDDDNWFDDIHIESLVGLIEQHDLDFAHSLRKVYCGDQFLANDYCESVGRSEIAWAPGQHLVDTSCYLFKREFIQKTCHLWNSGGWGEDRRFFHAVKDTARYDTTGLVTMNYRLPDMDKAYGGARDIFHRYNSKYLLPNGKYVWEK